MSRKPRSLAALIAVAAAGLVGLTISQLPSGALSGPSTPTPLDSAATSPAAIALVDAGLASLDENGTAHIDAAAVSNLLNTLPAATAAPTVEYDREAQFGQRWADVDRNGCDTRNDILGRDLTGPVFKPGTRDCKVIDGELHDAYTGKTIPFEPGQSTQIDHLWPLSLAWHSGAATWTDDERTRFANDPANLQAVDGPTNQSKGDSGPSEWLPPAVGYHCEYVARFVFVAAEYSLAIDELDRVAIGRVLEQCGTA